MDNLFSEDNSLDMGVFNYRLKDTTLGSRFLLAFDFFCFLPEIPLRLTSVTPPFFLRYRS